MKPSDFSIQTCDEPSVRVYYNGYSVIRLEKNGLHRTHGQPSVFPINDKGQIKVVRKYQYPYYHEFAWHKLSSFYKLALNCEVAELAGIKFFLRSASDGVALVGVMPGHTAYTILVIDHNGLCVAPGCQAMAGRINLDGKHAVRVWRD